MEKSLLGSKVRDKVTGFTGIAITQADHLTGCRRFWVEGRIPKDGKEAPGQWIDEARLEIVQRNAVRVAQPVVEAHPSPADCARPDAGRPRGR